jgi:lipopolysaccharide transport system ATP-binding protein
MAATLAGASEDEIERILPDIISFADIGEAIDEPVRTYSTGMTVRLAFAVNSALQPDLLISDEVLAVGDVAFQKKCITWLEEFLANGGTLLLVSHSLYHVQKLCQRACWLHQGRIMRQGDVFEVTQAYMAHHESRLAHADDEPGDDHRSVLIRDLKLGDGESEEAHIMAGSSLTLQAMVEGSMDAIQIELRRNDDSIIMDAGIDLDPASEFRLELDTRALLPGRFQLRLKPMSHGLQAGPVVKRLLEVTGKTRAFGSIELDRQWSNRGDQDGDQGHPR